MSRQQITVAAFAFVPWMLSSQVFAADSAVASGKHAQHANGAFVEKGNWPETLAATRECYQATNAVMAVSGWWP